MVNKNKIFIGFFLIILGLLAALSVFYINKVEPELKLRDKLRLEKLKTQQAKVQQRAADIKSSQGPPTSVQQPKTAVPSKPVEQLKQAPTTSSSKTASSPASVQASAKTDSNSIDSNKLLEKAKQVYGPEEHARREGTLWIDRKTNKLVVTLGALHGLNSGKTVAVYDGDQKIGQFAVDVAYDVISYVHPVGMSLDQLSKDYYRAVIE